MLYTKLGPDRIHKAPISIQIKIYLWSFIDYQHIQKYFYNWNITLNYCFIYKINIKDNFIWKCSWSGLILEIWGSVLYWLEKALFLKKEQPLAPYSIPFLSVLHRNKALYNFLKRGQCSIVDRNIGLEYFLLVASNPHMSTILSHPLWLNVNNSTSYVLAVPMIMYFNVLKYFFSGKISFFSICLPVVTRSQTRKNVFFFQKSWPTQQ